LSDTEIENFNLMSIAPDASVGCIIECDLSSPPQLHDQHSDYPMAAEHLTISQDMLSPFASISSAHNDHGNPVRNLYQTCLINEIRITLQKLAAVCEAWPESDKNSPNFVVYAKSLVETMD